MAGAVAVEGYLEDEQKGGEVWRGVGRENGKWGVVWCGKGKFINQVHTDILSSRLGWIPGLGGRRAVMRGLGIHMNE